MDFSKLKGKIFFNNSFINSRKANIHVLNHSLHFASSVFEGIGVYNGKPLFLKEHLIRLKRSSEIMKLSLNYSIKNLEKICRKLVSKNRIRNGYIRPIVFRSSHSMSPETKLCKSQIAIAAWKWGKLFKKRALSLEISKYPKLNKSVYPVDAKSSGGYQTSVIARSNLEGTKFDDCLMLDLKSYIAETSACNIFWIKKNVLYTPTESAILNGVTRRCVLKICKLNQIKYKTGNFKLKDIYSADYAFMTGTAAEIQPIKSIRNVKYKINSKLVNFLKIKYESIKEISPNLIEDLN